MVSARPDGTLPPEGCIWDPQERRWGEVRLCPGATRAGGGGAIRVRRMRVEDIRRFGPINDACRWTATFSDAYYAAHIHRWPDMCLCAEGGDGELMGYIIGKSEAGPEGLFVHVTALTVKARPRPAPCDARQRALSSARCGGAQAEHRRRGIASRLMAQLEVLGAARLGALYVDLFVKEINARAVAYYKVRPSAPPAPPTPPCLSRARARYRAPYCTAGAPSPPRRTIARLGTDKTNVPRVSPSLLQSPSAARVAAHSARPSPGRRESARARAAEGGGLRAQSIGYVTSRVLSDYYDDCNALDMRKCDPPLPPYKSDATPLSPRTNRTRISSRAARAERKCFRWPRAARPGAAGDEGARGPGVCPPIGTTNEWFQR